MLSAMRSRIQAALLCGLLASLAHPARAQGPWTPAALRAAEERSLARGLEADLEGLPGLARATARVRLPSPLATPVDTAPAPPEVFLTLQPTARPASGGLREAVWNLTMRTVPGLVDGEQLHVHWLTPTPPPEPMWARVGPFQVHRRSAGWLRASLLLLLGTAFALAGLLLRYAGRARRR